MKTSNYVIYFHIPETDEFYLVHGYTGAVDLASPEAIGYLLDRVDPSHTWHTKDLGIVREAIEGRTLGPISDDTIDMLKSRGYLTEMSSAEELRYVEKLAGFLHNRNIKHSRPNFMIVPVYECNLRCPYCFETDTRVELGKLKILQNVMTEKMVDAAFTSMDVILKQRSGPEGAEKAYITLYGGEPLMLETLPMVEYIVRKGLDENYRFGAITNAVDLDHFLHLLGPEKIGFLQITLDGPREAHNKKRIGPRHRQGTYDRIIANMKSALKTGVRISVRFHVDYTNISQVKELIDDLENEGFQQSENFDVYTYPIHGFHRGKSTPQYPLMAIHQMQRELNPVLPGLPTLGQRGSEYTGRDSEGGNGRKLKVMVSDEGIQSKLRAYVKDKLPGLYANGMEPCAATIGLYIFDSLWRIYTCWDTVGIAGHETGTYSPGGPVLNTMNDDWLQRSPATIDECKQCKYAFFHFGGCASLPIGADKSIFAPACYEFQDNFLYAGQSFFRRGLDDVLQMSGPETETQPQPLGVNYGEAAH
ncbi:MAG TPA: radical SAM protein [Blastocatellia bacterium]|nr:radical SAM protein [Blastocatellia bacterium]